jgi:hypothetical protein
VWPLLNFRKNISKISIYHFANFVVDCQVTDFGIDFRIGLGIDFVVDFLINYWRLNMEHIKQFLRDHYSTKRLIELLAFVRDGKLRYESCCCLVGGATADHPLRTALSRFSSPDHYFWAKALPGAVDAEAEYYRLGTSPWHTSERDAERRRLLAPVIEEELARRAALIADEPDTRMLSVMS